MKHRRRVGLGLIVVLAGAAAVGLPACQPAKRSAWQAPEGGPLDAVRLDPTSLAGTPGYFRVGQDTAGRWWFVDPDGRPFFYRGVTSINRAGTMGGQFAQPGPYTQTVDGKYASPAAFRAAVLERLQAWNFNALGAWCTPEFWDQGWPYTIILDFRKVGPALQANGLKVPDVFDPQWLPAIDARAKELCAPHARSRLLVGYFTDNELSWCQRRDEDRAVEWEEMILEAGKPTMLQACLGLPEGTPARTAAWAFVLERHGGDAAKVAQAYGLKATDAAGVQAELVQVTAASRELVAPAYRSDDEAFSRLFARRYFQTTAEAIRRHDPNHLILGCRFGAPPGAAILAEHRRPFVDVLSANNYRYEFYERMDIYYRGTGLPILNGEFSWGHGVFAGRGKPDEPVSPARLERMVARGTAAMEKAARHPALVGYTWYRWVDTPGETPPVSNGLVNVKDEPNRVTTDALTVLNPRLEKLATEPLWPTPRPASAPAR